MPRPKKGARLYLRERGGRDTVWVIRDGTKEIGTGCGPHDLRAAEGHLARYLARRHEPSFGDHTPSSVLISDVIALYGSQWSAGRPTAVTAGYHFAALLPFWGDLTCADVSGETCRGYVAHRTSGGGGRRPVRPTTARRELETLSAALGYAYKEKRSTVRSPSRTRARHLRGIDG